MRIYDRMTHGDALIVLKLKTSSRYEKINALALLVDDDGIKEMNNLTKDEMRAVIETITERKMKFNTFVSLSKEELLGVLVQDYYGLLENDFKEKMNLGDAENILKNYISPQNRLKVEKFADAIETILWFTLKSKKRINELEKITKDFRIGEKRKKHFGKKMK